ncbi:MAG: hypothetical protein AB1758_18305 [Candidatus Eremiobacterota bacterium]
MDVLFKPVAWMCLPAHFDGLSVETVSQPVEVDQILSISIQRAPRGYGLFRLSGSNAQGYVAAGLLGWREDELDYHHSSGLLGPREEELAYRERSPLDLGLPVKGNHWWRYPEGHLPPD